MSLSRPRLSVFLSALLLAASAHAQQPPLPAGSQPPDPVPVVGGPARPAEATIGPIKFGDITVDAALEMLERWSGRSVLRPAGLPATSLSFSLNQKVTREEAREALETLLTMNGIAVSPLGTKFLKVTPLNTARTEAPDFIEGSTLGLPPSGRIAQKLFQLQFLRASEIMPQIAGLLNPGAASPPLQFEKANAALITDTVSNLQRIESLINRLDQPALSGLKPKFYKVQNTLTGATATSLGTGTIFQADDRTNQIILLSDPRQFPLFDDLIAKLDTVGESSTRQEVIALMHATATDIAGVLSTLVSGQNTAARAANQATQNQANARNAAGALNLARNTVNQNANQPANPAQNAAQAAALAAAQARLNQLAGGPNAANDSAPQQFSTILTIVADERSNALIVSGTVDDLRLIKDLISQLDILLAQVRIEVVIAEISLTDAASTGIEALGLTVQANKLVGFSGSLPGVTVTNGTLTRDATTGVRDLAATLNLSTTPRKSNTNILSVPNIVTTHNKEATLFVGESRPVITSYQNTGTNTGNLGSGYSSNVTYKDIGINLTVKPLIGHDGSVQLEIKQEVNDILGEITIDGNAQPIIGSRTTESFVSVNSGEIVVLGGLQRKALTKSTSRLAGIPILGDLLGKRSRENTRTDLVFFLRPYVLTNTAADNAEAMERLKVSPQHDDVQSALKGVLPAKK
ncbi:MAG: secretin N-terminal domain-containing protein [Lacunisphaera sp.]|nr:secretin N-terminal domain-containing protein [Lacunisphaera sp.]